MSRESKPPHRPFSNCSVFNSGVSADTYVRGHVKPTPIHFGHWQRLFDCSGARLHELELSTFIEYVDGECHRRLIDAAGLHNLIVHQYAEIDFARLMQIIRDDLDDLRRFVAAMRV